MKMGSATSKIRTLLLGKKRALKEDRKSRYRSEWLEFERLGGKITHSHRILSDWDAQAGTAGGHYFHQDLLVANLIFQHAPLRHIDIASRIDGFVAHVAAFRKIEIADIRPLEKSEHENIQFLQADLMTLSPDWIETTDSISCLHAIEHFGLGRYGDPLDPDGHLKGFSNLIKMLKPGGRLYISFPIGKSNEVHFNAHRVFHPRDILSWPGCNEHLELLQFDFVDDSGRLHQKHDLRSSIPTVNHGCGIYTWKRVK